MIITMAINYASKYAAQIDERFSREAFSTGAVNQDYDFVGVKTVNVYSIPTAKMNDYSKTGANRYGTPEELETIKKYALKINEILTAFFAEVNIELIDFKLEFGRLSDGTIVLADEISPDTCRFWDSKTHEKLDKDRFRRDLGNVEGAYHEILHRLMGE